MPNWVLNEVEFTGEQKEIEKIKEYIKSEDNDFDFEKIIPMPSHIFRGSVGEKEFQIYGEDNWYDWSRKNWGTKWNSSDAEWHGDDCVTFETAWTAPVPVFEMLSKLFPDMKFKVRYADEDLGSNCGTIEYDGKSFVVNEMHDFEFSCDVWGYDPDEMQDEDDECYNDEEDEEELIEFEDEDEYE